MVDVSRISVFEVVWGNKSKMCLERILERRLPLRMKPQNYCLILEFGMGRYVGRHRVEG